MSVKGESAGADASRAVKWKPFYVAKFQNNAMLKRRLVETLTDEATRIDTYSVYKRDKVFSRVWKRMRRLPSDKRDKSAYAMEIGSLSRRQFLKILGFGIAGAATAGILPGTVSKLDHEPIAGYAAAQDSSFNMKTIPSGEEWGPDDVGASGGTLENTLIDQTADGAGASLGGTDLINVGFDGEFDKSGDYQMYIGGGGTTNIENVYMDNLRYGASTVDHGAAIGGHHSHTSTINVKRTFVRGYGNNASYVSSKKGGTGHFKDCFFINNTPGHFRTDGDGSTVENCVAVAHDPDERRQIYGSGGNAQRCIWASRKGTVKVSNCSFWWSDEDTNPHSIFHPYLQGSNAPGPVEVSIEGPVYAIAPSEDVLYDVRDGKVTGRDNVQRGEFRMDVMNQGVPLSPEMAAKGESCIPPDPRNHEYPREYSQGVCGSGVRMGAQSGAQSKAQSGNSQSPC